MSSNELSLTEVRARMHRAQHEHFFNVIAEDVALESGIPVKAVKEILKHLKIEWRLK